MPSKRNHNKRLPLDDQTDYLYDYFMNSTKINEQLKGELDEDLAKKIENHQPKLDSRVVSERPNTKVFSSEDRDFPEISPNSDDNIKPQIEFNDEDSDYSDASTVSPSKPIKSPYGQMINAIPKKTHHSVHSNHSRDSDRRNDDFSDDQTPVRQTYVEEKYVETAEERRARAREEFTKLEDLVEKYGVTLTRRFTVNDDPDEMAEEYKMHKDRRNKNNQVKFYKQILLNVVCGAEFLNDKYNPFEFKLKDWSKQVALDLDDYTEVLEDIYEKYRDKGGKMAPEIKLLFMIIMSGVTFHLSQALFGPVGLNSTLQNNPNVLNKLLGPLLKGGGAGILGGNKNDEPIEARDAPAPNHDEILSKIKKFNQNKASEIPLTTTENRSETSHQKSNSDALIAIEKEKRIQAELKADFENQLRKQQEMHAAQIINLKNQMNTTTNTKPRERPVNKNYDNSYNDRNYSTTPKNQVLSDASRMPRFTENPMIRDNSNTFSRHKVSSSAEQSSENNIFMRENNESTSSAQYTKKKKTYSEIEDSLGSTEVLDDLIPSPKKSIKKPIASVKKSTASVRKPITSTRRRSNTGSDILSTTASKKNNILKI